MLKIRKTMTSRRCCFLADVTVEMEVLGKVAESNVQDYVFPWSDQLDIIDESCSAIACRKEAHEDVYASYFQRRIIVPLRFLTN